MTTDVAAASHSNIARHRFFQRGVMVMSAAPSPGIRFSLRAPRECLHTPAGTPRKCCPAPPTGSSIDCQTPRWRFSIGKLGGHGKPEPRAAGPCGCGLPNPHGKNARSADGRCSLEMPSPSAHPAPKSRWAGSRKIFEKTDRAGTCEVTRACGQDHFQVSGLVYLTALPTRFLTTCAPAPRSSPRVWREVVVELARRRVMPPSFASHAHSKCCFSSAGVMRVRSTLKPPARRMRVDLDFRTATADR